MPADIKIKKKKKHTHTHTHTHTNGTDDLKKKYCRYSAT